MSKTTTAPALAAHAIVTLDTPIIRGEQSISTLQLRRPKSGELRGLSLSDLVQLDVGALGKLLPRITTPTLTSADVDNLDPSDLMKLGAEVVGFFIPADKQASLIA